jgi:hypothetical protein
VLKIKKTEYTNEKVVILYAYPCIGPDKSLFWQHKYTKDGCEGKNLCTEEKLSFVYEYWCIGAKKSQPKLMVAIVTTN